MRRKFYYGSLKGIKKENPSDDFLFYNNRFKQQLVVFKKFVRYYSSFNQAVNVASKDEVLFGTYLLKKKKSISDSMNEKSLPVKNPLSESVLQSQKNYESFYDQLGKIINRFSISKADIVEKYNQTITKQISEQVKKEKFIINWENTYKKMLYAFNTHKKKYKLLEQELQKAEKETESENEIKKKIKKEKVEEKKLKNIRKDEMKFENMKKLAIWTEQKMMDELIYYFNENEETLANSMLKLVSELKESHKKAYLGLEKIEGELKIKQSKRKDITYIERCRDTFKLYKQKAQIGIELEEIMKRHEEKGDIPMAIQLIIDSISHRKNMVGLFRVSGDSRKMKLIIRHLEFGSMSDLRGKLDVHTMCSMFKEYLKRLPSPFCPFEYFEKFATMNTDIEKIEFVKSVISKRLAPVSKVLCYKVFKLFKDIVSCEEENKMNVKNLAICMAFNTLRYQSSVSKNEKIEYNSKMISIFKFIVINFDQIFADPPKTTKYEKKYPQFSEEEIKTIMQKIIKVKLDNIDSYSYEVIEDGESPTVAVTSPVKDERKMRARYNGGKRKAMPFDSIRIPNDKKVLGDADLDDIKQLEKFKDEIGEDEIEEIPFEEEKQ